MKSEWFYTLKYEKFRVHHTRSRPSELRLNLGNVIHPCVKDHDELHHVQWFDREKNTMIDDIVAGVEIELQSASDSPVTVNVSRDETGIVGSVEAFVEGFNAVIEAINQYDSYDSESEIRGPLLGDPTVAKVKQDLYRILQQRAAVSTLTDIELNLPWIDTARQPADASSRWKC